MRAPLSSAPRATATGAAGAAGARYNPGMPSTSQALPASLASPLARLLSDLQEVFGARLVALVAHGPRVRHRDAAEGPLPSIATLALVRGLEYRDLSACATRAADWRKAGLGVPLMLEPGEFERSLDAFPVEYGDIVAHHLVVFGADPFAGISVRDEDLRRALETWSKGHLIHLREGFVESGGDARRVASLIVASAPAFSGLLSQVARLRGVETATADALARATEGIAGLPPQVVSQVLALEARPAIDGDTAMTLYPAYLDATAALARFLDGWARG